MFNIIVGVFLFNNWFFSVVLLIILLWYVLMSSCCVFSCVSIVVLIMCLVGKYLLVISGICSVIMLYVIIDC